MTPKTRVSDILETVANLSGHPLNHDEGVQMGQPDREVGKALVCWMASQYALLEAEHAGVELVIAHESLFFPYGVKLKPDEIQPWETWQTNRQRREIIERAEFVVARVHGSADEICIFDVFASLLGIDKSLSGEGYCKVYEIDPIPLKELVAKVKQAVGMDYVRISCSDSDLEKKVRCVGLPWGGLGLDSNVSYQQAVMEMGCDVLIAGESDSYGFRFSAECGVPMIETSHETSEIPGLRRFAAMLGEKHPDVAIDFHDNGTIWRLI